MSNFWTRDSCGACGGSLRQVLDLGSSPLADEYTFSADDSSEVYPLRLAICERCSLAQLLDVVKADLLFNADYGFYSSASSPVISYQEQYASEILRDYGELARWLTIEIGSNDGDLLRHFHNAGCRAIGIDPSLGPVEKAVELGLDSRCLHFSRSVAENLISVEGKAGVVLANHVIAHVEDLRNVLEGISILLADDGVAVIEAQYISDLVVNNAFDLLYHEHRFFFSLSSLDAAVREFGLRVSDAKFTDRQGGSLRAFLTKSGDRSRAAQDIWESEAWLRDINSYAGLQSRVERVKSRFVSLLEDEKAKGHKVAAVGAPAKATTLLNFCGVDSGLIQFIEDTTPVKWGRYVPGTGIKIVKPSEAASVDTYAILPWNYVSAILRNKLEFLSSGGRIIVPLPSPVII